MFQFVVTRVLWLVPTLLAMALVTFLVMHATPGSPLDPVAEGANPLSPEAQKVLAEALRSSTGRSTSSLRSS